MSNPLKLSMIFEAIDRATGTIRSIASELDKPARAAAKIGHATSEAIEGLSRSYEGMAATIGAGIEIKEFVDEQDALKHLQVQFGITAEKMEEMHAKMLDTASSAKVGADQMVTAFDVFLNSGGSADVFEETMGTMAAGMQILGGHGDQLGEMFAALQTKMGLVKNADFLDFISTARRQLLGVAGGVDAFSASSQLLMSSYAALGHTGLKAAKEVSAVYAVIARGVANPRQARSLAEELFQGLQTPEFQNRLMGYGIHVFNNDRNPNSGVRSISDILTQISKLYARNPYIAERAFGPELSQALKIPIGEIRQTGKSATLDRMLTMQSDPASFMQDASEASTTLDQSLNGLNDAMKKFGDERLSGPIEAVTHLISTAPGLVAWTGAILAGTFILGRFVSILNAILTFSGFKGMGELWETLGKGLPVLIAVEKPIAGIALRFAALFETLAGAARGIPLIGAFFDAVSGGLLAFGVAIEATPLGWFLTIIGAVAGAGYLIYRNWNTLGASFKGWWQDIVGAFAWGWSKIQPIADRIAQAASAVGRMLHLGTGNAVPEAGGYRAFGGHSGAAALALQQPAHALSATADRLAPATRTIVDVVPAPVAQIAQAVPPIPAMPSVSTSLTPIADLMESGSQAILRVMRQGVAQPLTPVIQTDPSSTPAIATVTAPRTPAAAPLSFSLNSDRFWAPFQPVADRIEQAASAIIRAVQPNDLKKGAQETARRSDTQTQATRLSLDSLWSKLTPIAETIDKAAATIAHAFHGDGNAPKDQDGSASAPSRPANAFLTPVNRRDDTETTISIRFDNLPPGTAVKATQTGDKKPVSISTGGAMVMP